jgi:hypothetical protein
MRKANTAQGMARSAELKRRALEVAMEQVRLEEALNSYIHRSVELREAERKWVKKGAHK